MARILIVDDSSFARHMLKVLVEGGGHEVVGIADDGDQALSLFQNLSPDVVTLDWLMPAKSGEAVLKKILNHQPDARVIMISGWATKPIEDRVMKTGAKSFIEKTNVERDLLKAIDQVMAG